MITRKALVAGALAAGVTGLAISATAGWMMHAMDRGPRSQAAWKDKFENLQQMARGTDVVVLARAGAARPGRVAESDGGSDSLPFELVSFTVERGFKGARAGDVLTVERVGGSADGESVYFDGDGGAFEPGRRYLLFLKRQDDGSYFYQVNDEGRYHMEGGRLKAVREDGRVAATLHGRPAAEGFAAVARAAHDRE